MVIDTTLSLKSAASERGLWIPRYALLGLICLLVFFWRVGCAGPFDLDDGLYAACARQMALTGDLITPVTNARTIGRAQAPLQPFYEKPILIYWTAAASMRAFGISPASARFPATASALVATALVVWFGTRLFGRRAGWLAGLVYATAPMVMLDARQLTTDGLLVLFIVVAMIAFWRIFSGAAKGAAGTAAAALLWTACAAAVLTKGAVGLVLPLLAIGIFLGLETMPRSERRGLTRLIPWRRVRWSDVAPTVRRTLPLPGILLFLALAVPWHAMIWHAGGKDGKGRTWVREYVIGQHIGRFRGTDTVHNAPPPTYLAYFLVGFFPWSVFAPAAMRYRDCAGGDMATTDDSAPEAGFTAGSGDEIVVRQRSVHRFLLIWFWSIFIFFSMGAAKLPNYIAPVFPAAALLVGRWLDRAMAASRRRRDDGAGASEAPRRSCLRAMSLCTFAALVTALLLLVVAVIAPILAPRGAPIPADVFAFARAAGAVLTAGSLLALLALICFGRLGKGRAAAIGILVATMYATAAFIPLAAAIAPRGAPIPADVLVFARALGVVLTAGSLLALLALITFGRLERGRAAAIGILVATMCAMAALILVVAVIAPRLAPRGAPIPADVFAFARALGAVLTAGSLLALLALICFGRLERGRAAAIGIFVATMCAMAALIYTRGYDVANRDFLDPYQELARLANGDADRGIPIVYYNIVPRRPSMNFFARYSPFEMRGPLIVPAMHVITRGGPQADLVTTVDTLNRFLRPEIGFSHGWRLEMLKQTGGPTGWALVRLSRTGASGDEDVLGNRPTASRETGGGAR
jgi:4-amino-4-deoxy-L-arabinose transferase-like glycosyltransferase